MYVCLCVYVCMCVCMYVPLDYASGLGTSTHAPCAPREPKFGWSLFSAVVVFAESETIILTGDIYICNEIMEQASSAKHENKKIVVSYRIESISY